MFINAAKSASIRNAVQYCTCGKTVHGMCTPVSASSHFSLAPCASISENPALTHSGGTWAGNSKRAVRGATGAKGSVPARARIPKPERRERTRFPQLFNNCGKQVRSRLYRLRDSCPRRNAPICPCRSARGPSGIVGPRTAAMSQRGIVSDWSVRSKRKIGEDIHRLSHPMHSFSTSANFVVAVMRCRFSRHLRTFFSRSARFVYRTSTGVPEENVAYFRIFLSGRSNS